MSAHCRQHLKSVLLLSFMSFHKLLPLQNTTAATENDLCSCFFFHLKSEDLKLRKIILQNAQTSTSPPHIPLPRILFESFRYQWRHISMCRTTHPSTSCPSAGSVSFRRLPFLPPVGLSGGCPVSSHHTLSLMALDSATSVQSWMSELDVRRHLTRVQDPGPNAHRGKTCCPD